MREISKQELMNGLFNLYHDYTFYVIKSNENYTDNDFTFDKFMSWIKKNVINN